MRISDWSSDVCSSDLLVGDEPARRVQKQHAKNFLGQRAHRGLEIFDQFRAGGFDNATEQFGAYGFEAGLARGKQKAYDRTLLAQNSRQRLGRSEEHTSELQSLMRNSYAVFCLTKKQQKHVT